MKETDMRSNIITIIGNVASGKTSAAPLIVEALGADFLDADTLFQTEDPFRELYLQNTRRWALTNELWLTMRRAELLEQAISMNSGKPLVIDSGLLMSWVYTYSHLAVGNISQDEWELYEKVYNSVTKNLLSELTVIHLNYSMPTLLKRLKQRGRDYELAYYTRDYLMQLESGLNALITRMNMEGLRVLEVPETKVSDFIAYSEDKDRLINLVNQACLQPLS
jgi:deoxyguanosine kinase